MIGKRDLLEGGLTVGELIEVLELQDREAIVCFSFPDDGLLRPVDTADCYSLRDDVLIDDWELVLRDHDKCGPSEYGPDDKTVIVLEPIPHPARCIACGEVLDAAELDMCRHCEADQQEREELARPRRCREGRHYFPRNDPTLPQNKCIFCGAE